MLVSRFADQPEYTRGRSRMLRGDLLASDAKREALASFVHRFTGDKRPDWSRQKRPDGSAYPLQFANDSEWLRNTYFAIVKSGALSRAVRHCESHPTWPDNPELRK